MIIQEIPSQSLQWQSGFLGKNLVSQWIGMNLPLFYAKTLDNVNKGGDNDSRLNCK